MLKDLKPPAGESPKLGILKNISGQVWVAKKKVRVGSGSGYSSRPAPRRSKGRPIGSEILTKMSRNEQKGVREQKGAKKGKNEHEGARRSKKW